MSITAFHAVWSAPTGGKIELDAPELLTAIVGALLARKNYRMILVADETAVRHFHNLGLRDLYHDFKILKPVPGISPEVFWAAGKIFAHRQIDGPSLSIDLDAVLWKPLPWGARRSDVVALHPEPTWWPIYKTWTGTEVVQAYNTGVFGLLDDRFKNAYLTASIEFMREWGRKPAAPAAYYCGGRRYAQEMVIAEQWMLGKVARQLGARVATLGRYREEINHMESNSVVSHVWNIKQELRNDPAKRERFLSDMFERALRKMRFWGDLTTPWSEAVLRRLVEQCDILHFEAANAATGQRRWIHNESQALPGDKLNRIVKGLWT